MASIRNSAIRDTMDGTFLPRFHTTRKPEIMCQSNAYVNRDGKEELILEDVGLIKPEGDKVLLISIFGEERIVDADIKLIDLLHHKIVLEKA